MKIIHTSDWHLGQNFMGKSRLKEHEAFLSWLLKIIEEELDKNYLSPDLMDDTLSYKEYIKKIINENEN